MARFVWRVEYRSSSLLRDRAVHLKDKGAALRSAARCRVLGWRVRVDRLPIGTARADLAWDPWAEPLKLHHGPVRGPRLNRWERRFTARCRLSAESSEPT